MSEMIGVSPVDEGRRVLRFNSPKDLAADLQMLRSGPVRGIKKWTLPQVCWHLSVIIENNLVKPDVETRTPEQEAMKAKFFGMVLGPQGMPENLPAAAPVDPPADCGAEQIDRLIAAFEKLSSLPHTHITIGRCGPVHVDEVRQIHLAHAAHHLSFIKRAERRKDFRYPSIDALISDLRRLERGYVKTGNWSLPQMCFHLNQTTNYLMSPGPHNTSPAPADGPAKLKAILASGQIPGGIEAPQHFLPADDCADASVEELIATLERLKSFAGPFAPHRLFGELSVEDGHRIVLLHAARHLSFLVPTTTVIPVK